MPRLRSATQLPVEKGLEAQVTSHQTTESAHVEDKICPIVLQPRDELRPPVLTDDKVRIDGFQSYWGGSRFTTEEHGSCAYL